MDERVRRPANIRAWLEDEISDGAYKPGDFINEKEVCDKFGVSRTPVREALLQLAAQGLVTFQPRKGAQVILLPIDRIIGMWETLTHLEVLSCELAARRMNEQQRKRLLEIHNEAKASVEANNVEEFSKLNAAFHRLVWECSGNQFLVETIDNMRHKLKRYGRRPYQRPGGLPRSYEGHEKVMAAILEGKPEEAGAAMGEHVAGGLVALDFLAEAAMIRD